MEFCVLRCLCYTTGISRSGLWETQEQFAGLGEVVGSFAEETVLKLRSEFIYLLNIYYAHIYGQ